jgi:hypothetical protein
MENILCNESTELNTPFYTHIQVPYDTSVSLKINSVCHFYQKKILYHCVGVNMGKNVEHGPT